MACSWEEWGGQQTQFKPSTPPSSTHTRPQDSVISRLPLKEIKTTERTSTTNKTRRIGEFDWELFKKSVFLNAPTDIALTFVDYISDKNQNARRFDQLSPETLRFIEEVERVANAPVSLISTRFHYRSVIDRRSW
ncbi:MAG: adenylosuccinate synthetase [Pirellulales bacterium]|nr:adenylosuccinate synthetase [Pirellulales bacterium]